jgi:pimeloyl-ACP methyl ester carboxylesterase
MMYPSLRGGNKNPGFRETFYGEVDDVIAAARFLAQLDYVDPKRIYLGGHSTGGTLALLVAASTDQFRAVFALGPVGNVLGYGSEVLPFDTANLKEAELRAPRLWLNSIHSRTFVFEGNAQRSNIGELRAMAVANRNPMVTFRPIPGGTHFSIIAPLIREISQRILKDDGETVTMDFKNLSEFAAPTK